MFDDDNTLAYEPESTGAVILTGGDEEAEAAALEVGFPKMLYSSLLQASCASTGRVCNADCCGAHHACCRAQHTGPPLHG